MNGMEMCDGGQADRAASRQVMRPCGRTEKHLQLADYDRRRARCRARRVCSDIAARPSFDCLKRSN